MPLSTGQLIKGGVVEFDGTVGAPDGELGTSVVEFVGIGLAPMLVIVGDVASLLGRSVLLLGGGIGIVGVIIGELAEEYTEDEL